MEWLSSSVDIIILVAAVLVAITNIYKFFSNSNKGIRNKVKENREESERAEEARVRAIITKVQEEQKCATEQKVRDIVSTIQEEQSDANHDMILGVMNEALPGALAQHDIKLRDKYKGDRERYLHDITDEVISNMQDSLRTVETHETRMTVFSEVLKELLRERIMAVYRRNKAKRTLEEHEKIELDRSYSSYKSINGNSYIDDYYKRMLTWAIIPDDYKA